MLRVRKPSLICAAFLVLVCLSCSSAQPGGDLLQTQAAIPPASQEIVPTDILTEESNRITKTVNAITGGEIVLSIPGGDTIQLIIPPFALSETTEITLVASSKPLDSPFKENFFPRLSVRPDGLSLRLPATLIINMPAHEFIPGERIFYLKSSDLAIPLWQSKLDGTSLTGKISHFSDYVGGSPDTEEAKTQAAASGELGGEFPNEWRNSLEGNQALNEWGNGLNEMGLGDDGSGVVNQARERLINDLECLMDINCAPPKPLDPCGDYLQMLMQYYQQAVLLAIDPESPLMDYLYDLLKDALNECTNRYSLEYSHKLKVNQMGLQQDMLVTGKVIFTAPVYGVSDGIGPLKMEGSGTVKVSISGQMTADDETCTLSGSGSNGVTITGQLEADELGNPWIALDVSENWYTSGSMMVTCPDGESKSIPLPGAGNQQYPLRFQYEDGAKSIAPNLGGMQGEYVWILHILHTW
ncbi:MAG: hypothetical protein A2Y88_07825 [Chloroflexi bacterium RBG_13_48_10]|nr:MAG: hypothetical protein A2Y88_07825 [Chloroflexi bacterium RBG_13_48_10]